MTHILYLYNLNWVCTLCILGDENCRAISATACRFNCRSLSHNCPKFHQTHARRCPTRILTLEGAYHPQCNYVSAAENAIWKPGPMSNLFVECQGLLPSWPRECFRNRDCIVHCININIIHIHSHNESHHAWMSYQRISAYPNSN